MIEAVAFRNLLAYSTQIALVTAVGALAAWALRIDVATVRYGVFERAAPVRVGGNIQAPRKLVHVAPEYPPDALASGVQGVVILEVTIDGSGHVGDTRVLRSIPSLDQAAIDAVRQWVFEPTLLNGSPVPVIMTTTLNFTIP